MNDIYAYLVVLNSPAVHLLDYERRLGNAYIMGCLSRVQDYLLELNTDETKELAKLIVDREKLNGEKAANDPKLVAVSGVLAFRLLRFARKYKE